MVDGILVPPPPPAWPPYKVPDTIGLINLKLNVVILPPSFGTLTVYVLLVIVVVIFVPFYTFVNGCNIHILDISILFILYPVLNGATVKGVEYCAKLVDKSAPASW